MLEGILPCACVPFAQMTIIQCISFYKENRHEEKSYKMFIIISVKHTHKIKMLVPTLNVNTIPLMTNKDLTCVLLRPSIFQHTSESLLRDATDTGTDGSRYCEKDSEMNETVAIDQGHSI